MLVLFSPSLLIVICVSPTALLVSRTTPSFTNEFLALDAAMWAITLRPVTFVAKSTKFVKTTTSPCIPWFACNRGTLITSTFAHSWCLRLAGLYCNWCMAMVQIRVDLRPIDQIRRRSLEAKGAIIIVPAPSRELLCNMYYKGHIRE